MIVFDSFHAKRGDFSLSINHSFESGRFISLIGPSGSGKTTLLQSIAGLIPHEHGSIIVDGIDLCAHPPHKRNIGMVFQDHALFPHLSIFGNIAYAMEVRHYSRPAIQKRVAELLERVNLHYDSRRPIQDLSGGERQRVAIARALAHRPKILLLDEPLNSLDFSLRRELGRDIRDLQDEQGISLFYVTHDHYEALAFSHSIAVLRGGEICQIGKPTEIYKKPRDAFVARLMGDCYLLPATLKEKNTQGGIVSIHGSRDIRIDSIDKNIRVGSEGKLLLRPESLQLKKRGGDNLLSVEYCSEEFREGHWQIFFKMNHQPLSCYHPSPCSQKKAWLRIDPSKTFFLMHS